MMTSVATPSALGKSAAASQLEMLVLDLREAGKSTINLLRELRRPGAVERPRDMRRLLETLASLEKAEGDLEGMLVEWNGE